MEKERRTFPLKEIRVKRNENDDTATIEGHAAIYNSLSEDLGGFREKIEPGAFDSVLDNDVRALFNHDKNMVLARTKSETLVLETDNDGLKYRFEAPDTTAGRDLTVMLDRGDVDQSSFGFRVKDDEWEERNDGTIIRTIKEVERLFDVSPVTYPAYPDTDVAKREYRSFVDAKESEQEYQGDEQPDHGLRKLNIRKRELEQKMALTNI